MVTPENDPDTDASKKTYACDPHLDPQLVWAGKAEHTSFQVPTVSLHVHKHIDTDRPIRSTADVQTWYTTRPWQIPQKSHVNRVVYDSTWEANETFEFDRNENVSAWVKNDHLAFAIYYTYQGAPHTYYPDFLIRLKKGEMLVLETKGKDDQQNRTKREFLDEWVRAVNADGRFGQSKWAVSKSPPDVRGILEKAVTN